MQHPFLILVNNMRERPAKGLRRSAVNGDEESPSDNQVNIHVNVSKLELFSGLTMVVAIHLRSEPLEEDSPSQYP